MKNYNFDRHEGLLGSLYSDFLPRQPASIPIRGQHEYAECLIFPGIDFSHLPLPFPSPPPKKREREAREKGVYLKVQVFGGECAFTILRL